MQGFLYYQLLGNIEMILPSKTEVRNICREAIKNNDFKTIEKLLVDADNFKADASKFFVDYLLTSLIRISTTKHHANYAYYLFSEFIVEFKNERILRGLYYKFISLFRQLNYREGFFRLLKSLQRDIDNKKLVNMVTLEHYIVKSWNIYRF